MIDTYQNSGSIKNLNKRGDSNLEREFISGLKNESKNREHELIQPLPIHSSPIRQSQNSLSHSKKSIPGYPIEKNQHSTSYSNLNDANTCNPTYNNNPSSHQNPNINKPVIQHPFSKLTDDQLLEKWTEEYGHGIANKMYMTLQNMRYSVKELN